MRDTPIRELIDRWQPRKALADEVGATEAQVHKWAKFDRIPSQWQGRVVQAAQAKGLRHVTAEWMLAVHDRDEDAA